MDHIRIFSELAFANVAKRLLTTEISREDVSADGLFPLPEEFFLDEARVRHPELSDDSLLMIYRLGVDDWSHFEFHDKCSDDHNIFQALAFLSTQLLDDALPFPLVHFKDLFRWREVTQLLGEDLPVCALLAFQDRHDYGKERRFDWPTVLHNDNPHLNYLFRTKKLCELHSHLKATTNTFEISWVSLMNHTGGKTKLFETLVKKHEPSQPEKFGKTIYDIIAEASRIRWNLYRYLKEKDITLLSHPAISHEDIRNLDSVTELERNMASTCWIPDYICLYPDTPMAVYAGERMLIYSILKIIFAENNPILTSVFYRYILSKSLLRSYFIQINDNVGFNNFKRYQDIKTKFLTKEYQSLIQSLPLWEASTHNHTLVFESRVTPPESVKQFAHLSKEITRWTNEDGSIETSTKGNQSEWGIIFHFLKTRERKLTDSMRNETLRKDTKSLSHTLSLLISNPYAMAVDAASSEFEARPEVFSQSFRFLRHFGFDATFHAGEDFYDLADGLRSIDETITLLELRASDRIGHALALGLDPAKYYATRHDTAALPKQYMLDNAVWLMMKAREYGICPDKRTEWFLHSVFKDLCRQIGYDGRHPDLLPDIADYWDSMALRGDNPNCYDINGNLKSHDIHSPDLWEYYGLMDSERTRTIRNYNKEACRLYCLYHYDMRIKENGSKVKSFKLPEGYRQLIFELQEAMIKDISKRQLCIECCPSSNIRIGRIGRYESHPIFRFMPIEAEKTRYPLAVTVNTDDLGVFSTSLPNEFSLLTLALLKMKNHDGTHRYSTQQVYDWIERVIENGHKFSFVRHNSE